MRAQQKGRGKGGRAKHYKTFTERESSDWNRKKRRRAKSEKRKKGKREITNRGGEKIKRNLGEFWGGKRIRETFPESKGNLK